MVSGAFCFANRMQPARSAGTPVPGGGTVRWHDSKETQLVVRRFQQALSHHKRDLTNLQNLRSEYSVLGEQLLVLPQSISHHIMVPVGTQAMFPGKLVKTNEITVLLGDNYFVKCSAHYARGIVDRRLEVIDRKIAAADKQVLEYQLRIEHALEMSSSDGVCEIMEPYDVDDGIAGPEGTSRDAQAAAASDLDVEEERSNIEETEARLRFMFGNEDEWVDDEDGSSGDGGDCEADHSRGGDDDDDDGDDDGGGDGDDGDDGNDDDDDDNDDVQIDSGVDTRYLADFTESVQSRRALPNQAPASSKTSPIVTTPAQLYDMLFTSSSSSSSSSSQAPTAPSRPVTQPLTPNQQAASRPPPTAPRSPPVTNNAFSGRIVEKTEHVALPSLHPPLLPLTSPAGLYARPSSRLSRSPRRLGSQTRLKIQAVHAKTIKRGPSNAPNAVANAAAASQTLHFTSHVPPCEGSTFSVEQCNHRA